MPHSKPRYAPHPATVVQPKALHSALITQLKASHAAVVAHPKVPHPATVASSRPRAVQRAMGAQPAFPGPDERLSLPYDAADLFTTLTYLEESIKECAVASKNSINQGKAEIHFTCSIKKGSVVDTIFRCRHWAEWCGSELTHGLAWYDPQGAQASLNVYGPHITIASSGKQTGSGRVPIIYHHVYFKYGETKETK